MSVATLATATSSENRKAVIAGTIGNVLEWFGVYGYLATTMSQLFFPGEDKTISLLKAFAVFGVGFVMRPVGSILFGIYGDRFGRRLALSAVIFLMALSTLAIGLLPTYAQVGVLAPVLLVICRLLQGLSAGALAPAWHGSQNLCSALVAAVVHVNGLAARDRNTLAHFHERLATDSAGGSRSQYINVLPMSTGAVPMSAHYQEESEGSRASGIALSSLTSGLAATGNCNAVARWPTQRRVSSTTCPSGNSSAS
jgi:Sugar (and other) transporter